MFAPSVNKFFFELGDAILILKGWGLLHGHWRNENPVYFYEEKGWWYPCLYGSPASQSVWVRHAPGGGVSIRVSLPLRVL